MLFHVTFEVRDLGHVFLNPAISAGGRGGASVFSTLVPLLIQMSMLFLLSPSLLVRSLAASSGQEVGRLWCRRRWEFFDGVVVGFLGGKGL